MMDADDPQKQYSQISPNFKLQKIEMWVPIGFGLISLGLYIGLIVAGFFGPDYYRVRSEKEQEATFFEEEIKDDTTYALLILLSAVLGFMRAVFDDVAGPQWSRLVNPHNTKADVEKLVEAYSRENLLWATIVGGRTWTRTSDALLTFFAFTDLYIFLGGFVGNVAGGILMYKRFFDSRLSKEQQLDFSRGLSLSSEQSGISETPIMHSAKALIF